MPSSIPQTRVKDTEVRIDVPGFRAYDINVELRGAPKKTIRIYARDAGAAMAELHLMMQIERGVSADQYRIVDAVRIGDPTPPDMDGMIPGLFDEKTSEVHGTVSYPEALSTPKFWEVGIPDRCNHYVKVLAQKLVDACRNDATPAEIIPFEESFWRILYYVKFTEVQLDNIQEKMMKSAGPIEIINRFGSPWPDTPAMHAVYQEYFKAAKKVAVAL